MYELYQPCCLITSSALVRLHVNEHGIMMYINRLMYFFSLRNTDLKITED
jgi:hypothetical protein